ncbi:hypothetical protein OHA88_02110 [Streptomyces sp. NBC_00353]
MRQGLTGERQQVQRVVAVHASRQTEKHLQCLRGLFIAARHGVRAPQ